MISTRPRLWSPRRVLRGAAAWQSAGRASSFDASDHPDEASFAELHKRLWSWGGVPLIYRAGPGLIQLFRCAHEPDFAGPDDVPICNPIRTLMLRAANCRARCLVDAERILLRRDLDDPDACDLMLSATKSAHRKLVAGVRALAIRLTESHLLDPLLRRPLLILSLLVAYLEERSVLLPDDFARVLPNASRFFEVLGNVQCWSSCWKRSRHVSTAMCSD